MLLRLFKVGRRGVELKDIHQINLRKDLYLLIQKVILCLRVKDLCLFYVPIVVVFAHSYIIKYYQILIIYTQLYGFK